MMSKFTTTLLFNLFVYLAYKIIDALFAFLNLYSNPKLGETLSIMPTTGDVVLIALNILLSSLLSIYLLYEIKAKIV
ncbi:MAG: hypothetical protein P794_03035 [Epsilonproteobacteria bacterium (ex Lamellibrachia satsuma)]|nr:MAG: hypothetical protein P794_03035 [Epsilonproteobacteria bacterium (ex Lamellibrachia satsuma)]